MRELAVLDLVLLYSFERAHTLLRPLHLFSLGIVSLLYSYQTLLDPDTRAAYDNYGPDFNERKGGGGGYGSSRPASSFPSPLTSPSPSKPSN